MSGSQLAGLVLRIGVCRCAGGNDESGQFSLESFCLLHLLLNFFDAQRASKQAVFVFALNSDYLGCGSATGRNFNIEINTVLCLTVSAIRLSPKRFETMFRNVLAK